MRALFRFFASRPLLANLVTISILVLGAVRLATIKRDLYPDIDVGELVILTRYPGASPEDVERKVTAKIEDHLKSVTGVERTLSTSMENVSVVHVVLASDVTEREIEDAARSVREAVAGVTDFPEEVTESPLVTLLSTSKFPMLEIGVRGDVPYRELRAVARRVQKRLEQVPGVSEVERDGWRAREVRIEVLPEMLRRYKVSLPEIVAAIKARNVRATGGTFESFTSEQSIVTLAQFRQPLEVGEVIVRASFDGPLVRVRDLATVEDDLEEPSELSRVNGEAAISLLVYKTDLADIIRTRDRIRRAVDAERKSLPPGVELVSTKDNSRFVQNRFQAVLSNGLTGLVLVFLVLALFLDIRTASWVALGIPVTMMGVTCLLPLFGVYLDTITLGAMLLVIGIVVDDGIVISERIHQRYEQGLTPVEAAVEGTRDVFWPVVTMVATIIIAFLPMFLMPGTMGKFCFVIPLTVTLCLLVSLLETAVALPVHILEGLRHSANRRSGARELRWFDHLRFHFTRVLYPVLRLRYVVVLASIALLAGSLYYAARKLSFVLFPSRSAERFYIQTELPPGMSLQATAAKVAEIEAVVAALGPDELDSFSTRIGRYNTDKQLLKAGEQYAVIAVDLTAWGTRSRTADEIVEGLRDQVRLLHGYRNVVFWVDAEGPPVGKPVTLRVVGNDDALRKQLADEVERLLTGMSGVADIDRDDTAGKRLTEIKPNFDRLARLGLSVAEIAQNVRIAYDGEVVTKVRYGDEEVSFRVQLAREVRRTENQLREVLASNRTGQLIQLSQVADFVDAPGPATIYHYNGERSITLSGDVTRNTITPSEVASGVLSQLDLRHFPGLQVVVGGEAQESEQAVRSLLLTSALALLGVYVVLSLLFDSLLQPFIPLSVIPLAAAGVATIFAVNGEPLSFTAVLGAIGLVGVAVNDALLLIDQINDTRRSHRDEDLLAVVSIAASSRLRAVLSTALTTVVGLLPLAGLGTDDPVTGPMALSMGYGLVLCVPLTLFLVPCFYLVLEDLRFASRARPATN